MKKLILITSIPFILFAYSACGVKEEQKGQYLAKVGNTKITPADLERDIKTLPELAKKLFEGAAGKEKFLDEMIKKEMLYQEAVKRGLDKDPEYLRKVEEFKKLTVIGQLLEKEIEQRVKKGGEQPTNEKTKEVLDSYMDNLIKNSKVEINKSEVNKLQ